MMETCFVVSSGSINLLSRVAIVFRLEATTGRGGGLVIGKPHDVWSM
jgi:hypothetical protein